MAYMLKNINDAVDGKFLVTKTFPKQAEAGTIVHIMDARKLKSGGYQLDYRVLFTYNDSADRTCEFTNSFIHITVPHTFEHIIQLKLL